MYSRTRMHLDNLFFLYTHKHRTAGWAACINQPQSLVALPKLTSSADLCHRSSCLVFLSSPLIEFTLSQDLEREGDRPWH